MGPSKGHYAPGLGLFRHTFQLHSRMTVTLCSDQGMGGPGIVSVLKALFIKQCFHLKKNDLHVPTCTYRMSQKKLQSDFPHE